jgi:N-methylhydantoinase B
MPWLDVQFLTFRLLATAAPMSFRLPSHERVDTELTAERTRRCSWAAGWFETPVYRSSGLRPGHEINGPAIVEEPLTVWHSLQRTCREMRHIIMRTAQNYLIGQLQDVSVGIWRADGTTVAIAQGIPSQMHGTRFAIRSIVERFEGNLAPGDVILANDPYHGGHNGHLPDWGFFRPIFHDGELLFFALARAHQQDTGGSFPGGYFPNGFDIHAEGLCIPPIKVVEGGKEREDVLGLIWNNVRWPSGVRVDNYAMIAATKLAEDRVEALIGRYGRDETLGCTETMMDRTEKAIR